MQQASAESIFKEFKEHSISEFFRKNSQMLGYSGKVRSLTTIVHEYVTNSLDACEEAGILPEISVSITEISENKYLITVSDNGPGIPSKLVGKAMATILAGTKFHRYLQQRGQQGIGAAGCTMYSLITTGKPIHVKSSTGKEGYECDISIDIKTNKPIMSNLEKRTDISSGTVIEGTFGDIKYEESDHGVYEYLKRTALSNPHTSIKLTSPDGKDYVFIRSVNEMPKRPKEIKPHPLGIGTNDLIDFAHKSESKKLSSFLVDTFSRVTPGKVTELKEFAKNIDFEKNPADLTWEEAEIIVKSFKEIKWVA
ncbi:MAG: DNA topoisomerase VI subunit B, partial [Candidatus Marsarchaeota archaeon]|nr:DNA topoisomerase VI subunit B [Candidatus Marsarchaeota archaeon]